MQSITVSTKKQMEDLHQRLRQLPVNLKRHVVRHVGTTSLRSPVPSPTHQSPLSYHNPEPCIIIDHSTFAYEYSDATAGIVSVSRTSFTGAKLKSFSNRRKRSSHRFKFV
jgi:hypothetical protein